jgi:hypothetical protein
MHPWQQEMTHGKEDKDNTKEEKAQADCYLRQGRHWKVYNNIKY